MNASSYYQIPCWELTWTGDDSRSDWPTPPHVYRRILVRYVTCSAREDRRGRRRRREEGMEGCGNRAGLFGVHSSKCKVLSPTFFNTIYFFYCYFTFDYCIYRVCFFFFLMNSPWKWFIYFIVSFVWFNRKGATMQNKNKLQERKINICITCFIKVGTQLKYCKNVSTEIDIHMYNSLYIAYNIK